MNAGNGTQVDNGRQTRWKDDNQITDEIRDRAKWREGVGSHTNPRMRDDLTAIQVKPKCLFRMPS